MSVHEGCQAAWCRFSGVGSDPRCGAYLVACHQSLLACELLQHVANQDLLLVAFCQGFEVCNHLLHVLDHLGRDNLAPGGEPSRLRRWVGNAAGAQLSMLEGKQGKGGSGDGLCMHARASSLRDTDLMLFLPLLSLLLLASVVVSITR